MARIFVLILTSAVLAVALAGCLGGDDDPTGGNGGDDDGEALPSADHGVVRGRLLTMDDLQALPGGLVRLVADGESIDEKRSDEKGDYVFRQVEPGTYRLQVSTVCCREEVRGIQVKAEETIVENFALERLPVQVIRTPFVDVDGEWEGFINCGVAVTDLGPLYPAACQQGTHSVRDIVFFPPGIRTITISLDWDPAGADLGADTLRLTVHNLNAKFALIGEVEGTSPLELQIQNLALGDEERFDLFDEAGWVARFEVTPVTDSAAVLYQQRFTLRYHVHYWQDAPSSYRVSADGAGGAGSGLTLRDAAGDPLRMLTQSTSEPNPYQEGPNSDCLDYNVLYDVDGAHSPMAVRVEVDAGTGYVIDSSLGRGFVDFYKDDGEYLTWSLLRHWGNVPADAGYGLLCIGVIAEYPDVPDPFATWFYMDGFPTFE